jgi:hypothetical protein
MATGPVTSVMVASMVRGIRRRWPGLALVIAAFVVSRVVFIMVGIRFDDSAIHPEFPRQVQWQLLSTHLLQHDLLKSTWYLHSQPPLYNLFAGLLLHLPAGERQGVAAVTFSALGLAMVIGSYLLMGELSVRPAIRTMVCLLIIADPSYVLFENWLSWSYPTAAFLSLGAYGTVRLVRSGSVRWSAFTSMCLVAVIFLDTTFQWPWFLLITMVVGFACRRHWRRVLIGAALPGALLLTWSIKDAVLFGTDTTSSWLGMNLTAATLSQAPPAQIRDLVRHGRLAPIAAAPPFASVEEYTHFLGPETKVGVKALDEPQVELGVPNFNNAIYVKASERLFPQAMRYIRVEPAAYGAVVRRSVALWLVPSDQYSFVEPNYARISDYARGFDAVAMLQWSPTGVYVGHLVQVARVAPPLRCESMSILLVAAIAILGAPVAAYRARRRLPVWVACSTLWVTVVYSFALTSLAAVGENMRFHFELGPVPLILATVTVVVLFERTASHGAAA